MLRQSEVISSLRVFAIATCALLAPTFEQGHTAELNPQTAIPPAEPRITVLRGNNNNALFLEYQKVKQLGIFQGDIVLGTDEELLRSLLYGTQTISGEDLQNAIQLFPELPSLLTEATPLNVVFGIGVRPLAQLWPQRIIPYVIADELATRRPDISKAIDLWNATAAVRFIPTTEMSPEKLVRVGYISINSAEPNVCVTYGLGRSASKITEIHIGENCSSGAIAHELGHAIGLGHEQLRADREKFVSINTANITTFAIGQIDYCNWRKGGKLCDSIYRQIGNYNLCSLMHYPAALPRDKAWLVDTNGDNRVFTLTSDGTDALNACAKQFEASDCHILGQLCGPSKGDVETVNDLYKSTPWQLPD